MSTELYYIQDTRVTCGNSVFWWRVDGHGYTCNLDEAWKVPLEKASIHRKTDVPRRCAEMDALAERHVDVQKLPKERKLQETP